MNKVNGVPMSDEEWENICEWLALKKWLNSPNAESVVAYIDATYPEVGAEMRRRGLWPKKSEAARKVVPFRRKGQDA